MEIEKIHQSYRQTVIEHDQQKRRIQQLELANMELTAALADTNDRAETYKYLFDNVLMRTVEQIRNCG